MTLPVAMSQDSMTQVKKWSESGDTVSGMLQDRVRAEPDTPSDSRWDTSQSEPADTSTAPVDSLPSLPQDTLRSEPDDTLPSVPKDTLGPEPLDVLPEPIDIMRPNPLDTVNSPVRDRIPPHLRDAVFPGENRPPQPRESIFPRRAEERQEAPEDTLAPVSVDTLSVQPADTLQPLTPDQLPELPDTLAPVLPDTLAPELPDTLSPQPQDTLTPAPSDTLQTLPAPEETDLPAPEETDLPAPDDTTSAAEPPPADEGGMPPDQEAEPEAPEEPQPVITPLPDITLPGYRITETDSTNRWNMALNRVDRIYRDPGVITYRTGRLGVPSGIDIHTYELRHQTLQLNDMPLASPVTGQVNWNRVPIHKIRTIQVQESGYLYQTSVQLREHYTVQPMTFLNFDEGSGDYRNLEFSFAHNFTPRTHLELAFWDRRDGDLLPRNRMEGRQIVAKGRHHLDERHILKVGYINNGLDQEQSLGYEIPDLMRYHFNPYGARAVETSAESNTTTNDLYVHIQQRPEESEPVRRAAGINYQTEAWRLSYSQDTTAWRSEE